MDFVTDSGLLVPAIRLDNQLFRYFIKLNQLQKHSISTGFVRFQCHSSFYLLTDEYKFYFTYFLLQCRIGKRFVCTYSTGTYLLVLVMVSHHVLVLVHWSSVLGLSKSSSWFKTSLPSFFFFHSLSFSSILLCTFCVSPLSLLMKDSLLVADLTFTGSFSHPSIYLTTNEYLLSRVRPCKLCCEDFSACILSCPSSLSRPSKLLESSLLL